MKYTVVGFPRIGEHRELKFATEKYFRGELTGKELSEIVSEQRKKQWEKQARAGEDLIPSNDYSLYDGMLDTTFMLGAVPKRYRDLDLSDTDTYFAMARGYQGEHGDVTALAMKKWFNTNYHYMVPELEDDMELSLASEAFLDGFQEALSLGIQTRPVVIGPFTFIKLARITGEKEREAYLPSLVQAYQDVLGACDAKGVEWLQLDEPYLVMDLTQEDLKLFEDLYKKILPAKKSVRVLLQTYFGDIRDGYKNVCELDFDGIGLDFLEGKKTEELIKTYGFPKDKVLFAGLVNGKNIWRCNYKIVLEKLRVLGEYCGEIILSTSCSLLHVPYTTANETKLPKEVLRHFAFAYEKLDEMKEICRLYAQDEPWKEDSFAENQQLFEESDLRTDPEVQAAVQALTEEDFTRQMPRKQRQALQRDLLGLPLFPTTTIGSFPQTKEVKKNRSSYRKGEITKEQYDAAIEGFIRDCIQLQEDIGLDVLVHGEFERNDMVEFFGENLSGYVFTQNAWVQSYGTRGVKPPIVFGDIKRKTSITTKYIAYAQSLTNKPVKGMLTGPVTILNWSFPREDIPAKESMYQIGLAIRDEVLELEAAGIRIIQIDEAALREKLPLRRSDWHTEYLDDAIRAFRLCHSRVKPKTQIHTHMCYSEFEDIIPEIDAMDADVITFEASRSKLTILESLRASNFETEVGPGVYDIHSPRVPSVEEIEAALSKMLENIPAQNLWVNPDCGLKTRGNKETTASLANLVAAAGRMRKKVKEVQA